MSNKDKSNLYLGLIVCVIAVLFFVAGFLVSRLLNGGDEPVLDDSYVAEADTVYLSATETIRVEYPVQLIPEVPHAEAQQPVAQQPIVQQPVAQQPTAPSYRVTPRNLDLQVTYGGMKYYFSQSDLANLSSSEQSRFAKRGLVIIYGGYQFVVKLTVERHGSGYTYEDANFFTWDEAMNWVNNIGNGWRLPYKDEGKAMADQYKAVCDAIKAFGGDSDPAWCYWTSTEYNASGAWSFNLNLGYVYNNNKSNYGCVRAVRAI
ncbi:MAG: DUF1566 domain-containing protein [Muribaculaceae bacterium]